MRSARLRGTVAAVSLAATGLLLASTGCPSLAGFGGGAADAGDAGDDVDAAPDVDAADAGPSSESYLSLADAAKFCARVLSCPNLAASTQHSIGVPIDPNNYSACVSWLAGQLPPGRIGLAEADQMLQCVLTHGSCSQWNLCMWWEVLGVSDPRCSGVDASATNTCSPNLLAVYYCSANPPYIWHCDNEVYYSGSSCLFDNSIPAYECGFANGCGAIPPQGTACIMGNNAASCTTSNNLQAYDCSVIGLPCGYDNDAGVHDCLTNGHQTYCPDETAPPTCSGSVVSLCAGSFQGGIDCAPLGGTCDAKGTPRCRRPDDSCSPTDATVNVCNGDVISLCVSGQPAMVDCTTLGLHCIVSDGGAQTAHCG